MATTTEPVARTGKTEIRIISHSHLFYWWPVWAVGYLMALLTAFNGHRMATVPKGTAAGFDANGTAKVVIEGRTEELKLKNRAVLIAPEDMEKLDNPRLRMTSSKNPGVLFCIVLLLVIVITNIPLRGLWSLIVIILIILLSVIFALMGIWNDIIERIGFLDIRITMGGYVFISTVLLIIWVVAFLLFDQQIYMVFTPGQLRVCQEIGGGEIAIDTQGMTVQKQRSDLFRHWILGLGSGDLIVRTSGAHPQMFDLPNVLFLGRKVKEIEDMLRQRQVLAAQPD